MSLVVLLSAVPSPPGAPEVSEIRKNSCQLSWQPPESDGGAPVTGYIVERRSGVHWIAIKHKAKTEELTVSELVEGNRYEFRVLAENKVGVSQPSPPSKTITAKDPWSEYFYQLSWVIDLQLHNLWERVSFGKYDVGFRILVEK